MGEHVRRPPVAGTLVTHAPEETRAVGVAIAPLLEPGDVVLLAGPLGAGKTELVKGVAAGLGIEETVVSPTFTIAREYVPAHPGGLRLLHVDVYRLDTAHEVLDLGLEDLAGDGVMVVEWGDAVAALLPADHLEIRIELPDDGPDDDRALTFTPSGRSWGARAVALGAVVGGA
jgi:tRNA threonylcarbamoyladenosine biosynthesis protein TsaE